MRLLAEEELKVKKGERTDSSEEEGPRRLWILKAAARGFDPDSISFLDVPGAGTFLLDDEAVYANSVEKGVWGSPAGKRMMAKSLVAWLPAHKVYTEVFAGSGAVFFAKERAEEEILNDRDPDIAHAFKFVRDVPEAEIEKLRKFEWTCSREMFTKLATGKTPEDPARRFHRFVYLSAFSFFNDRKKAISPSDIGRTSKAVDRIPQAKARLRGVKVFNDDYETILRRFDGPQAVHFLDPPFTGYGMRVGEHEWEEDRFIKVLKSLKGKFLVTYGVLSDTSKFKDFSTRTVQPTTGYRDPGAKRRPILLVSNYILKGETRAPDGWEFVQDSVEISSPVRVAVLERMGEFLGEYPTFLETATPEQARSSALDVLFAAPEAMKAATGVLGGFLEKVLGVGKETATEKNAPRAIGVVLEKNPGKTGEFKYGIGLGPLSKEDCSKFAEIVEIGGKSYTPIGKTFETKTVAEPGDAVEVEFSDLVAEKSEDGTRLRCFTPVVVGPGPRAPTGVAEFLGMARSGAYKSNALWDEALTKRLPIVKTEEERFVLGVVLKPEEVDSQGEVYSEKEVRQTAHGFMEFFQNMGRMHREIVTGKVKVLESYLAPVDFSLGEGKAIKRGTWLLGVRVVDDGLWEEVKNGKLTGFSIGGSAIRVPEE